MFAACSPWVRHGNDQGQHRRIQSIAVGWVRCGFDLFVRLILAGVNADRFVAVDMAEAPGVAVLVEGPARTGFCDVGVE